MTVRMHCYVVCNLQISHYISASRNATIAALRSRTSGVAFVLHDYTIGMTSCASSLHPFNLPMSLVLTSHHQFPSRSSIFESFMLISVAVCTVSNIRTLWHIYLYLSCSRIRLGFLCRRSCWKVVYPFINDDIFVTSIGTRTAESFLCHCP